MPPHHEFLMARAGLQDIINKMRESGADYKGCNYFDIKLAHCKTVEDLELFMKELSSYEVQQSIDLDEWSDY
jgi:hypothetical protein